MSLVGSELEMGGHGWRVTSVVREGPEWRIVLKTLDGASGTITTRTEGVDPPTTPGELRHALERPESRSFLDEAGARWRAELVPRLEGGKSVGEMLVLAAERTSERYRMPYTTLASLAVLSDRDLRASLSAARRPAAPV